MLPNDSINAKIDIIDHNDETIILNHLTAFGFKKTEKIIINIGTIKMIENTINRLGVNDPIGVLRSIIRSITPGAFKSK